MAGRLRRSAGLVGLATVRARWVVAVVLAATFVAWLVLSAPRLLVPAASDASLRDVADPAKRHELQDNRLKLQNDVRTALLVLSGAAIGASVTLRQVRATRDQITQTATANRNQLKLSEQGQVTDRYTKAIDQLDDKKALAVRLGGLYALERIAHDSPADRATIAEVLCAYVRTAPVRNRPPGA